MATIRRKGDYQWHVQVRRKGYPTQTRTFETRAEAESWALVIESEMVRGAFVSRASAEKTTLRDLVERYVEEVSPTHRGHETEVVRLRAMARHTICGKSVANLAPADFSRYRDKRLKEVAPATVVRELGIFHHVLEHAKKEWGIRGADENPVSLVRRPTPAPGRNRRLSKKEEKALFGAIECCRTPWLAPMVAFALETAARQGELLVMEWKHVDLKRQTAHLPMTKNGDARTIPLSSRAVAILRDLPRSISGKVFPTTASAVKQAWSRSVDRAGLEDLHFHDLRHEATSRLAEKIPNVLMLAAVTGHKNLQMLKRYYHPKAEDLAKMLG